MANLINSLTIGGTTGVIGLPYGVCSVAAGTAAKTVTVDNFSLEAGAVVVVKFTYANSAANPTLNVNSTGAKAIYWKGAALASSQYWEAGALLSFVYNGTQWDLMGIAKDNNTTYTIPTSLPANGGNADTVDNKHASDFAPASHVGDTTHVTSTEKAAWNAKSNFSGSYNDLSNKPTILTVGTGASNAAAGNHTHGNITNTGTITSTAVTSATGVLVYDSNNKIQRATAANARSIIGAGTSNLAIGTTSTTAAAGNHTHNYAGSSSAGGAATSANKVNKALTFNNGGSGVASGTTFDGSTARTISYNTIGAAAASHAHDDKYYTKAQIDAMEFITIADIDTICGGSIVAASEVTY